MKLNIRTHFVFGRVSLDFTFISKYPSHCSRQHVLQHGFTQWLPPPSFTFMATDIYSNICWKSYLSTLYHVIIYVSMIFFHLSVWYTRVRCRCIVCFFNYLLHNLSYCFKNIRQFILLFKNTWNKNKCWYKSVKLNIIKGLGWLTFHPWLGFGLTQLSNTVLVKLVLDLHFNLPGLNK